jgi:hypothetical protein
MRRLSTFAVVLVLGVTACSSSPESSQKESKPTKQESPPPPCHPGCFPAGTTIATPEGLRPIEAIQPGDLVTLINQDGIAISGPVGSKFETCNRLVEVRTKSGNLLTTETQPLCLWDGGFRRAGELVEGDQIWRWEEGERRPARVLGVANTGREAPVFNLVIGESAVFVAGGFLARGKPPLDAANAPRGAE